MFRMFLTTTILASALSAVTGCGGSSSGDASPDDSAAGAKYVLDTEPKDAQDVIGAKDNAKDDEPIVVVGRIGGSADPWVEGKAAFSIVDCSLKACSDIEGDQCSIPWDYCCETDKLPGATALVKLVDDSGKVLATDARKLLQVKELQTIVVRGTAKRDKQGNLTVIADGVFVRP